MKIYEVNIINVIFIVTVFIGYIAIAKRRTILVCHEMLKQSSDEVKTLPYSSQITRKTSSGFNCVVGYINIKNVLHSVIFV